MRRRVSTGIFVAALGLGVAGLGARPAGVAASALPTPATMEVKIDNFTFGPTDLTVAVGHHRHVDESRRHSPHGREHGQGVQVEGAGYRREVLVHVQHAGHLSLLLFHPPEDDRQGRRAVRQQRGQLLVGAPHE